MHSVAHTGPDQPLVEVGESSARPVALRILLAVERAGAMTDRGLDRAVTQAHLDARERALAVELVHGSLRHRGTLDWRLEKVSDRRIARLPVVVQMILRLGAYQILNLSRIPPSAAVNESVRLVKNYSRQLGRDWGGYVNAVLRSLTRNAAPPWPESNHHPAAALAVRYSCPVWLAERWVDRVGVEQAAAWCRASVELPPLTLRVNTLRASRDRLLDVLTQRDFAVHATDVSQSGVRLEQNQLVQNLPLFHEGGFYVEDEAAQLVSLLLDPQPGERILDACAAPGGKATHMAALMKNEGEIIAMERNPARMKLVTDNCARLGISIVTPLLSDAIDVTLSQGDDRQPRAGHASGRASFHRPFDRILVDAPCSGLGVIRRHPEGKWYKQVVHLKKHQEMQRRLLDTASRLLRAGGLLVYSTCSTEPEENEQVIDHFCRTHQEFQREPVASLLPPAGLSLTTPQGDFFTAGNVHSMDGFYAARLRKAS
jgi:16S rRNA (cytosine967-C5)-methyltransferase